MNCYHPTAYIYAVSQACGGSLQDIGVENAIAVLINVPYYQDFLIRRMRCGYGDGIIVRNLFMLLRSVEMIAFLRVLSILHIAVCMPLRCLAGNCGNLSQHNFGVSDMVSVVEIMDKAFYEVLIDGEKLVNEDFIMGIFDGITKKLPPLQEYLYFMFKNKQGRISSSRKEKDKVLPWDLLRSKLFYPTLEYLVDTRLFCIELTCEAASIFIVEFRGEHKTIAKYLS